MRDYRPPYVIERVHAAEDRIYAIELKIKYAGALLSTVAGSIGIATIILVRDRLAAWFG